MRRFLLCCALLLGSAAGAFAQGIVPGTIPISVTGCALTGCTFSGQVIFSGGAIISGWTPSFVVRPDSVVVASGGTSNAAGDQLTLNDGCSTHAVLEVQTVSLGVVTAAAVSGTSAGSGCASIPPNPVSVLASTGSSTNATFTLVWAPKSTVDAFDPSSGIQILGSGAGLGLRAAGLGPTGYGFKCCGSGANNSDGFGGGGGMPGGEITLVGFFSGTQLSTGATFGTATGLETAAHEVDGGHWTYSGTDTGKYALHNNFVVGDGDSALKQVWNSNHTTAVGSLALGGAGFVQTNVTGAADNGSGLVRLTVGTTTGMTTNDAVFVGGIVGTTEANTANGATTTGATPRYITVIDGTHIDLQGTTFVHAWVSGGQVNDNYAGFVNYTVLGTQSNAGAVQLTVLSTINMFTGDSAHVSGVGGTVEANGDWTITVNNNICFVGQTCKITLQGSAFVNAWTSGGRVTVLHGPDLTTSIGYDTLGGTNLTGGIYSVTCAGANTCLNAKIMANVTALGGQVGSTTLGTTGANYDLILIGTDSTTDAALATSQHGVGIGGTVKVSSASVQIGFQAGGAPTAATPGITSAGYQNLHGVVGGFQMTGIGYQVGGTCGNTGNSVLLLGTNSSTDCASNSESAAIHIGAGGTDIIKVTGTNAPASAIMTVSGPLLNGGTKFTTSGCSVSATTGNGTAGTYTSGTSGSCAVVITMNGATGMTAPNGWACFATDRTTPADIQTQTATTTTTATITGTTVSGDVVQFACRPF